MQVVSGREAPNVFKKEDGESRAIGNDLNAKARPELSFFRKAKTCKDKTRAIFVEDAKDAKTTLVGSRATTKSQLSLWRENNILRPP